MNRSGSRAGFILVLLSVEGSVVGVLVLGRWDHSDAGVEPVVVVPGDPGCGREFDVERRLVLTLAGPEDGRSDALGLVQADD